MLFIFVINALRIRAGWVLVVFAMNKLDYALLLVLATVGAVTAFIIPAGKCRFPDIKPIKTNIDRIANFHNWHILYASAVYNGIDHEDRESEITGNNTYKLTDTRTLDNGTIDSYTFTIENVDDVLYERYVDENGNIHMFKIIILAQSPYDNSLLYYRCSEDSELDYDTRIIEIPKVSKLDFRSLIDFLRIDSSINFLGSLFKLPSKILSINI